MICALIFTLGYTVGEMVLNKIAQSQIESYEGKLILVAQYDDSGQRQEVVDMSRYESDGIMGFICVNPPVEMPDIQVYENALVMREGDSWCFVGL